LGALFLFPCCAFLTLLTVLTNNHFRDLFTTGKKESPCQVLTHRR
jgi:hypothetical protein